MDNNKRDDSLLWIFIIFFLGALAMLYFFGNLFSVVGIIGIIVAVGSLIGIIYQITRIHKRRLRDVVARNTAGKPSQ